jgi:two-component system, LytTR family, sensor kinase
MHDRLQLFETTTREQSALASPPLRVNWTIAIACVLLLALLFSTQNPAVLGLPRRSYGETLLSQLLNWGLWLLFLPAMLRIATWGQRRGFRDWPNIAAQISAGIGIPLLHAALLATVRWSLGLAGSRVLAIAVPVFVQFTFAGDFLRYCLIAVTFHALAFQRQARDRTINEAQLARHLAEARLDRLQVRLQPHFLFNTLNSIAALVTRDPAAAARMVENLGDLLRASLDFEPGREITLEAELELLRRYTAIQKVRFAERLTVDFDVDRNALDAYVPQMILQPIVENAIQHGLAPREEMGTVKVHASRQGEQLQLVVRDDGVGYGRSHSSTGHGIGMAGTRARLSHLYGDRYALDVSHRPGETGTVVTIQLPFRAHA